MHEWGISRDYIWASTLFKEFDLLRCVNGNGNGNGRSRIEVLENAAESQELVV